jgi:hypothetical protein
VGRQKGETVGRETVEAEKREKRVDSGHVTNLDVLFVDLAVELIAPERAEPRDPLHERSTQM